MERKKRRQRHVVQLKLQRNGGNNDFWKLSFCRDTVRFCQKKKKSRNGTEKRGYHPRTKCCYFGHLWMIMIYRLNMCTNFPNFIISTNYTGALDTLACFPNFKWLSQEIATNSDSVTMMWSCQQQLCALHFKTIWLQKTCFSVKITRIIFSQFVLVLPLHAKF